MVGKDESGWDTHPTAPESIRTLTGKRFELPLDISDDVGRLAPSKATVLVVGGCRELQAGVARALHDLSPRVNHPFIPIDCGAILPPDFEAVLFGGPSYVDGTRGAVHDADEGTLYLAAVHALPLAIQPRFLGYLDEGLSSRGRVVVSTDIELAVRSRSGAFRRDLAERLDLVRLVL